MLAHNGAQLAHGVQSAAARSFYGAFWRWSTIGCAFKGDVKGKRYASEVARSDGSRREDRGLRAGKRSKDVREGETLPGPDIFESSGIWGQKGWQGSMSKERVEAKTDEESEVNERSRQHSRGLDGRERSSDRDDGTTVLSDNTKLRGGSVESARTGDGDLSKQTVGVHERVADKVAGEGVSSLIPTMSKENMLQLYHELGRALSLPPEPAEAFKTIEKQHPSKKVSDRAKALSGSVRSLMRVVTQPVTVITTTAKPIPYTAKAPSISDVVTHFRGMTISSFTTVSLDPDPIISFNIRTPSSTLEALKINRHFLVHLPLQNSKGSEIAQAFTKGNGRGEAADSVFQAPGGVWSLIGPPADDLTAGGYLPRPTTGIQRAFRCELLSEKDRAQYGGGDGIIQVGDHVIVLARILAIQPSWEDKDYNKTLRILCYQHGDYAGTSPLESKFEHRTKMKKVPRDGKAKAPQHEAKADGARES